MGSSKNPIYIMQPDPPFRAQLWRTVRTLAVAFLLISGIGALFDERGLGRGILNNPDMKPQLDSKTKFEDVKGVDEAKVQPQPFSPTMHSAQPCIQPRRALSPSIHSALPCIQPTISPATCSPKRATFILLAREKYGWGCQQIVSTD